MKKKYIVLATISVLTMLVSMIAMCTVSVNAETHGSITLEYHHTDPASNGGHAASAGKTQQAQNNVKTGDVTASIAGGLLLAAVLSACTAWFMFQKMKTAGK